MTREHRQRLIAAHRVDQARNVTRLPAAMSRHFTLDAVAELRRETHHLEKHHAHSQG